MASTRSWCSGVMVSTVRAGQLPHRLDRAATAARDRCPRSASGCSGGLRTAWRTRRRGRNARCRRPGGRARSAPGSGRCGTTSRTTCALTEPTSVTIAPGARPGAMACATAPMAPGGVPRRPGRHPRPRRPGSVAARSQRPSSSARSRVSSLRAQATISPASPVARSTRASEPLISPMPISATRSKGRRWPLRPSATKSREGPDEPPVLGLEPDR